MPTIIKDIPSSVTKNSVVTSGFAITNPESAIAIAPNAIWVILNQVGDFSTLTDIP
jgi:hypothetical protein